jgi:hypothetical protein
MKGKMMKGKKKNKKNQDEFYLYCILVLSII